MGKSGITELVFIIDKSGSMHGLEKDTVGGFNSMLEKQQKEKGTVYISTVLFNSETEVLHDRVKLCDVKPLTDGDYEAFGCTALLDALGGAVRHIGNIHKYAREEDVPDRTMFVITTDGMENASRIFTAERVKAMIEEKKEKYGWEFLFIGANIDSVSTAKAVGISPELSVDYCADGEGTKNLYASVCEPIFAARCNKPVTDEWRRKIEKDSKRKSRS